MIKLKSILIIVVTISILLLWRKLVANEQLYLPSGQVLAFPFDNEKLYQNKILPGSGNYSILSESKIQDWASGQGFTVTADSPFQGLQYHRAIYFYPPGLKFSLTLEANQLGEVYRFGNELVLDFAFIGYKENQKEISSSYKLYNNLLQYAIFIDGVLMKKFSIGYGLVHKDPIKIPISFIRNLQGKINVEIRMTNHRSNFGILYDASILNTLGD